MFVQSLDPNLEIRLLTDADAPLLFALVDANRAYLRQWLPWLDGSISQQDSLAFIRLTHEQSERGESLELGVWLRGELVGMAGFIHIDWQNRSAGIGYWLAEAHQGAGVMTSAVRSLIQHGFDVWRLHRLEIRCATGNQRSCAIPRRLGFTHEGIVREVEWLYDRFVDHQVYGLLESELKTDRCGVTGVRCGVTGDGSHLSPVTRHPSPVTCHLSLVTRHPSLHLANQRSEDTMPAPIAALRMLDIRPIRHQGAPCLVLRDPLQLTGRQLMAPQPLAAVLQFCDGQHDVAAMCQRFYQDYQIVLPRTQVKALVDALDDAAMLDNQRYRMVRSQVLAAYRSAPFRTPALAGTGYSADSTTLARRLQELLERADPVAPFTPDWSRNLGVLSPHIDYPRGGAVYAALWKRAALAAQQADLVILLGTDHYGSDPFTLTRQNYATPFGVLPTARDLVDRLAEVIGEEAAFHGELRHRNEHSLELVAVWLHHMRAGKPVQVAPILVGSFQRFLGVDHPPADDPLMQRVLETLRSATSGRRVLVVASGDLAHVGPAFGGAALNTSTRAQLRVADERLIDCMVSGDADAFFGEIRRVQDRNNVCGVAPIYLAMSLLGKVRGEQMGYAVCPADDVDSSAVTISGVVFRDGRLGRQVTGVG